MLPTARLLPIDGFSYETAYGRFFAAVVSAAPENPRPRQVQKFVVDFSNDCHGFCLTRKLTLLVSPEALKRDRAEIIRAINRWIFADPAAGDYFHFELRWPYW